MDLEILEALALSEDRAPALAQLLPGSEDHDYYRALHAQHRGALAEAETILDDWTGRHGSTERYERLRLRQLLYRLGDKPADVVDEVRDHFGVQHWHEAEVAEVDPSRPTKLAPGEFDGHKLLAEAISRASDLSQVTDEGIEELVDHKLGAALDTSRRRAMLQRLGHSPNPNLVEHVAKDLGDNAQFGSSRAHLELTREQLDALAAKLPRLRTDARWIDAVIRRMRPTSLIDLEHDRAARESYLIELWKFVSVLPPASNSLKAHVLWHLLDAHRKRNAYPDRALVLSYLQLPRSAAYVPHTLVEHARGPELAQLGADFRAMTGLGPAGNDEELVRDLIHREPGEASHYAPWIEASWLEAELATAQLLYGLGNADRATHVLGPARAAALRERIDLAWSPHNPTRVGSDEPIVLEADIKHVPELLIKVFRVDPLAYFQHHRREVNTDLDLDGLAASHELTMTFSEPPVRRVRRRIDLPMCTRAGTYVIDLIGNGMSSRAVVHKGRLRHVSRVGAAGHAVTVVDETGQPRPDARAWVGDREYKPDERGTFVVPFSTTGGTQQMLLSCGDIAVVRPLELVRESYALSAEFFLDRQSLAEGVTARAVARLRLTVANAPASLSLIEQPMWTVTLTDRHGVATTKEQPLVLRDDDSAVLEWPLGESPGNVSLAIRGKVRVISEQREQEVVAATAMPIATMHGGHATEALYLAQTTSGWTLSALGKTGEPRAQRAVSIQLVHRWAHAQLVVELATDAQGRCELGQLPGVVRITASLGGVQQTWQVGGAPLAGGALHAAHGRDLVIAIPPDRDAAALIKRASLVELRAGVPLRHADAVLEPLAGGIVIRGLQPGEYALRTPSSLLAIRVPTAGIVVEGHVLAPTEIVELSRTAPVLAELDVRDGIALRVAGAGPRTRVHVIATRFVSSTVPRDGAIARSVMFRFDRSRPIGYVSGRELGDEYRYVLERRNAKRFPTLQLDKPSLLLNPWARRTTTTDVANARAGGAFAAAPAPGMAGGYAPQAQAYGRAADEDAYASYDFIAHPPTVLANLVPDDDGRVRVPAADLGRTTCALVIIDDPSGSSSRRVPLADIPLEAKDLRLRLALAPDRHAMQQKQVTLLRSGDALVIEDLATAKVHLIDSVQRAYAYLLALAQSQDDVLREFSFVTRWHQLGDAERREQYSKFACHELHLFLWHKDRPFFDAVVKPYLAHKRVKTFVDHWLLEADLAPYLEPWQLARLNAIEKALLAQRLRSDPALLRLLADAVDVLPPDPSRDARLIDVLLGASRLDADAGIEGAAKGAYADALMRADEAEEREMAAPEDRPVLRSRAAGIGAGGFGGAPPPPPAAAAPMATGMAAPRPPMKAKKMAEKADLADLAEYDDSSIRRDSERRKEAAPMFRAADKTQEWAENNWWHQRPSDGTAETIVPNRFWRELAAHSGGPFLSGWLGLATGSFAEMLVALGVIDLPFVSGNHAISADGPKLTIAAAANALAGSSQLVDGALVEGGPPLVVGQSYVRTDDRYRWIDGEQIDKYVEGSFIAGVVYTCQVVLANPSSTRQRIAALIQVPRGSIPLANAKQTETIDVLLEPYGTHGREYAFYFPQPGRYTHFPVHVSRNGQIVAAAPGRTLEVTLHAEVSDPHSWSHISQRGTLDEVVAYLTTQNLAEVELEQVAWRMRERPAYDKIIAALEQRHRYDAVLWGYALLHGDTPRIRAWLRTQGDELESAGPVLEMPIVDLDSEDLWVYEYLEYRPLTNARAHRLGPKHRILNEGLAAQYQRYLELVAHRPVPTSEDLLAGAAYLLAQDRNTEALATLARVRADELTDRMQYDYLVAYAACLVGDTTRSREIATRWRQHPVDRWRHRFESLANMLAELDGAAPAIADTKSREQQQAELAAKQPAFDLEVDREGVLVRQQHVGVIELRFFVMDVELLFSRQPFVQSDVSRFSFIEPGHREQLANPAAETRVPWPAEVRGKNVVVEAVGAGQRKAKIHYANDLATNVAHQYGQVRVQRASDKAPLSATYVKVYARKHGGSVAFYKDGYTDLRGWFDYATLSTNELDHVERFAILVCSDQSGASILEATPPAR